MAASAVQNVGLRLEGDVDGSQSDSVEAAMRALAEGSLDGFNAIDAEMGLSVTIVAKDADRYCVRRMALGVPEADANKRDEWRSARWIASMLAGGHWTFPTPN